MTVSTSSQAAREPGRSGDDARTFVARQASVFSVVSADPAAGELSTLVAAVKGAAPVTPAEASVALRQARDAAEMLARAQGSPVSRLYAERAAAQGLASGRLISDYA
ncbi:hypothetical protein [Methylopila turkensis]|uniref:Uncharacterized protein n=1 Tax=Methylopila turkensis TaxID=1437816 RepID=A0A9W6JKL2_9HYPH|nr:hypothetical protein [Methylopila turkensis]GLK79365.1 hypothetical protein GCM10008174_11060 [Methylopila turkensis]